MGGQNLIMTSPSVHSQSPKMSSAIGISGNPTKTRAKRKMTSGEKG
jgi:hypothetical protein